MLCREEGIVDDIWEEYTQVCTLGGPGGIWPPRLPTLLERLAFLPSWQHMASAVT